MSDEAETKRVVEIVGGMCLGLDPPIWEREIQRFEPIDVFDEDGRRFAWVRILVADGSATYLADNWAQVTNLFLSKQARFFLTSRELSARDDAALTEHLRRNLEITLGGLAPLPESVRIRTAYGSARYFKEANPTPAPAPTKPPLGPRPDFSPAGDLVRLCKHKPLERREVPRERKLGCLTPGIVAHLVTVCNVDLSSQIPNNARIIMVQPSLGARSGWSVGIFRYSPDPRYADFELVGAVGAALPGSVPEALRREHPEIRAFVSCVENMRADLDYIEKIL